MAGNSLGLQNPEIHTHIVKHSPRFHTGLTQHSLRFHTSFTKCKVSSQLGTLELENCTKEIARFDASKPVEEAFTPPNSWYINSSIADLEIDCVFTKGWQAAGYLSQVENPNEFFTGSLGRIRYVVCRDANGKLHAFHNVCRHHAAAVAQGHGCVSSFSCPYHGWTYGLDGKLQKATRISGIKKFDIKENGLIPIQVATWGAFVLINLDLQSDETLIENEWLGSSAEVLHSAKINKSMCHVARRNYIINCNWKVFCDNYLDGGYHVPYAHPGLATGLELTSYKTQLYEKVSIQSCCSTAEERRLGEFATYAFVYPNFMINRYGPWMDTNLVLPLAPNKCQVVFDYFLEPNHARDEDFITRSLVDSDKVQREDVFLCEQVQKGLESYAYNMGRYAPKVEYAMHHFHCLLHKDLSHGLNNRD